MKKFNLVTLLVVLALLVSLSVGVLAEKTVTIKVSTWADESLDEVIAAFNEVYPNIKVETSVAAFADHHKTLITKLAAGVEVPDVAFLEVSYIGNFAAKGGFVDLSKAPYNGTQYKDKIASYTFAQASTVDGRLIAMPTDIAPATLFVRKDRMDEMGFSIDDIKTMEDWIEVGKKFSKDLDGDGQNDRWLVPDAGHVYQMFMRSSSYKFFDEDGNVLVDSPRFIEAFKMAKKVRELGLDGKIAEWTNEWYAALRDGNILIQPSGAWLGGHLKGWIAPGTGGNWRAVDFPNNMYGFWGGSFAGIPEAAKNKDAAWKFIEFVSTNPEVQLMCFDIADMFPGLVGTYTDPMFDEEVEFYGGQKVRKMWTNVALNVPQVVTNKNDIIAEQIISAALTEVLENGKDPVKALKDAKFLIQRRVNR